MTSNDKDDDIDGRVISGTEVVKIEDDKASPDKGGAKTRPENEAGSATRSDRDDDSQDDPEDDDHDDSEGGDQAAGAEGSDEATEKRRAARREERKNRRRARRDGQRRQSSELAELREGFGILLEEVRSLRGQASNNHVSQIDQRLTTAENQLGQAEEALALAIRKGDGESAVEAQRLARQAERAVLALKSAKAQIEGRRRYERNDGADDRRPQRREAPAPGISEKALNLAQGWMASVPWYKPQGNDEDSEFVRVIDAEVMEDGFDPDTPKYYSELSSRISKELPHRYRAAEGRRNGNPSARRSGPPIGGSDRRAIGANEVVLDENRRKALDDANIDPQSEKGKRILRTWKNGDNKQTATR